MDHEVLLFRVLLSGTLCHHPACTHLIKGLTVDFLLCVVIENLPMEMRDKFTEVREMDLQVASKLLFTGNLEI